MLNSVSSYEQLVRQVEALQKENTHLRRELEDNSHHLSKLENETSDMKEVLKQLQNKLEQEACTLASSGRSDILDQLKELHMDLTYYYELKYQPHNLRVPPDSLAKQTSEEGNRLPLPSSSIGRAGSPVRVVPPQTLLISGEGTAVDPGPPHILEGALSKDEKRQVTAQHLDDLCKERTILLKETEKEKQERCWYYSQLQGLSQRLAELPRIDTFSIQMDLIRRQLEFEAQQLRSVMEERFGTSNEMLQRTQIRVARLEQLDKELHEAQEAREGLEKSLATDSQNNGCEKTVVLQPENSSSNSAPQVGQNTVNKVEMVFWLLSMLATKDREDMSRTLLAMSSSLDSCIAMRKSGCVPLLVQILHDGSGAGAGSGGCSREARSRAAAALHNIVYAQVDEGQARREMRVLHVLEQIRSHCESGWDWIETHRGALSPGVTKTTGFSDIPEPVDPQICQAMCAFMKLSFEEEYRRAMNELGGLQAVAELLHLDQELYGMQNDPLNMAMRRYAGMALTNLTFGDVVNKATLCSKKSCLRAIVAQLESDNEELHQVVSSILRNLSWHADINSKKALREVGSVSALTSCALQATKESTLKSLLSALWNLSAHSTENKVAICSVEGALSFLVSTLTYKCQTNSLAIIESGGGILRNVSSLVATREDYRQVLRDHNCLQTLLQHLRSHSLTIVSNACGTLWNLSARNPKDQELLWDLGAVSMLRNLIHSKHKMIAMGSAAALRNLLTNRPLKYKDAAVISPGSCLPALYMRKQKALEAELDAKNLAETFHSIEKQSSKHLNINKPLRHIESLAKDYASDSGCFDDDEAPNMSSSLDTGSISMLSMFLNNSNILQGQSHKKGSELAQDMDQEAEEEKKSTAADDEVSVVAEKLATKITNTVAKIDKLVEDITMHTSSEDSFSLSTEDHFIDWQYGSDVSHENRAKSCSPCRLSDTSSFARRERLSRAHALLRLKTAHACLSVDSLNSSSTSDGGSKNQVQHSARSAMAQRRPNKLDLKVYQQGYLNNECDLVLDEPRQIELPERDLSDSREGILDQISSETETGQDQLPPTPARSTKVLSEDGLPILKLSPSNQHVPLIQSVAKFGVVNSTINVQAAQAMRRQAWLPVTKFSPMSAVLSPTVGQTETPQKYSVENTPICFSRCSSLSSLSSGDVALDGQSQSENELDSESSLDIIELEECELSRREEQDETLADLSDSQLIITDPKVFEGSCVPPSEPFKISYCAKQEKAFLRAVSPSRLEDRTPSSSSENHTLETPLVMSRCSSVSSLGSFGSPSIASSIQSDPCSEMISGTISPSDLPDSPGQTMPPSRSKTPCCVDTNGQETQSSGGAEQWESSLRKFLELSDFKERFNWPPEMDTMIYFTVEKPTENFSCASSLSALPLHEHYIQKDVELKLRPLFHHQDSTPAFSVAHEEEEETVDGHSSISDLQGRNSEGNSDDDLEILKECINSAMPSKFRTVQTSMMPTLSAEAQKSMQSPVYMIIPNSSNQICSLGNPGIQQDFCHDDSSFTESADGTPVNYSGATSLSDEALQYPVKDMGSKHCHTKNLDRQEMVHIDNRRIEDLRAFSQFKKPDKIRHTDKVAIQMNGAIKRAMATQRILKQNKQNAIKTTQPTSKDQSSNHLIKKQAQHQLKTMPQLELPIIERNADILLNQNALYSKQGNFAFQSLRHPTPTEEAIYCFYDDHMDKEDDEMSRTGRHKINDDSSALTCCGTGTNLVINSQTRYKAIKKVTHNLIMDETPPCYSLSSSLSSLSEADLEKHQSKVQKVLVKNRHHVITSQTHSATKPLKNYSQYNENSSSSSVSLDSEDDLLQKCITSAMPKQRRKHSSRKWKAEKKLKLKNNTHQGTKDWNSEKDVENDEMASDKDSDLNSVEWRAIQEGANSVVSKLQAASRSQEHSSESESARSLTSGVSTGMNLFQKQEIEDEKPTMSENNKGNKNKMSQGRNSSQLDFSQRKPIPNLPVVFRGRTVIYMPKKDTNTFQRSTIKKISPKVETPVKNPNLAQQRSRSLHRLGRPKDSTELSLPKRSSTPPARIAKSTSSGSSQNSTPSKQLQRKFTPASQTSKVSLKKDAKPKPDIGKCDKQGKPSTPINHKPVNAKSLAHVKTQKSPVCIPFMQASNRHCKPFKPIAPLVTNKPSGISKANTQFGKESIPANRHELFCMKSTQSSINESDHSGFLRQLTFIKESSGIASHEADSSSSVPTSQSVSPQQTRTGAPAVIQRSPRCQELKATAQGQKRVQELRSGSRQGKAHSLLLQSLSRASCHDQDLSGKRPSRRTSSESPCRVPQKTLVSETFKRHASSPTINIANRVTSRSSVRSSSSDSSRQRKIIGVNGKTTWRRIQDEDVPNILKSTLPSNALPLMQYSDELGQMSPKPLGKLPNISVTSRKTSDATVQTEDFSNKTDSSTSPTVDTVPTVSEEAKVALLRKISMASGNNLHTQDGDSDGSFKSNCTTSTSISHSADGQSGGIGHFRHSSPSKAARVTPFNYTPSPMTCCLQDAQLRASALNQSREKLEA